MPSFERMRRGYITLLAGTCALTIGACNLLTGASSLTTDDQGGGGGAIDRDANGPTADGGGTADGNGPPIDGGSVTDGALVVPDGGSVCSGASCFDAGTCGGAPCPVRIIAAGTGKVGTIAADTNGVYWTQPDNKQIARLRDGAMGPDVLVTVPDGTPTALAAQGSEVFWTESDSGRVCKIGSTAPAGSIAAKTIAGQGAVHAIGIGSGGAALVWANAAGTVTEAAIDLTQPTAVASNQAPVIGVGLYAGQPYWGSAGTINEVRTAFVGGTLATRADMRSLAVDSSRIYWTSGTGFVESVTLSGAQKLSIGGEGEPVAIAVESGTAFWVNQADGRVRAGLGGVTTTLASGQGKPRAIAVRSKWVYWVNDTGGEVWALPR